MLIGKIHTEFLFDLDKLSTSALPEITSEGVDLAINKATESYIKNKYRVVKGLAFRNEGFESVQKRIDDLRHLVVTPLSVDLTDDPTDSTLAFIDLNSLDTTNKYQFYIRGTVKVDDKFTGIKIVKQDNLENTKLDPFNKSIDRKPRGYFEGNKLIIIKTPNLGDKAKITFLRRFIEANLNTNKTIDLSEHTHREIIELAVQQTLETIESERVNTHREKVISSE